MNQSGMLQALYHRYEKLLENDEAPPVGFRDTDVQFVLVLHPNGELIEIQSCGDAGARNDGQSTRAPYRGKRTSGIKPNFLCDTSKYLLGCEWGKTVDDGIKYFPKHLDAARELHLGLRTSVDHPHYSAVCQFLESLNPEMIVSLIEPHWKTVNGKRMAFKIVGEIGLVHDLLEVQRAWAEVMPRLDAEGKNVRTGQCSITGNVTEIANVHPPILGVTDPGGQAEKALVSFNCDAFTSYGLEQSQNAPASLRGAWGYTSALNSLLRDRRIRVGDMTLIYWADQKSVAEEWFAVLVNGPPEEDGSTIQKLRVLLETAGKGGGNPELLGVDSSTPFYVAGLSPSSSRIVVRLWLVSTVGSFLEGLAAHYNDLQLVREFDSEPEYPSLWHLLRECLPQRKNYRPTYDDLPPLLAGALMRAILEGTPYPDALANAVIRRIRADRVINYLRAAILKAWLIRKPNRQGEIPVSLDTERKDPAYRLGRLFAALEKTQEDAQPGINATIRERFYSSASATPAMVFPRLLRTYQHHLAKLNPGAKVNREKLVQEIVDDIDAMPAHLNLEDQARFAIGYYHQRKALFTKSETANDNQE